MTTLLGADQSMGQQARSRFEPDYLCWDTLTGLANRTYILRALQSWLTQSKDCSVSVILFNIDNFKSLNRSVGNRIGDCWLCAIAKRLQSHAGPNSLVGRIGGDEFLLVSRDRNLRKADVATLAREVAVALSQPVAVGGKVLERKVSASSSCNLSGYLSAEQLLRNAEKRMHRLREQRVKLPDSKLYSSSEYRDLQRAIDVGRQIEVHYQPEVDLKTGHVVGVEALARWQHPSKGLQPACNFIDLAERSGLVVPLSWLVLHRALNQMMIWRQRYHHLSLTVRVNASPLQVMSEGFANEVLEALAFHRLPASVLCIEVTEHQVMRDKAVAEIELKLLREQGVTVAIDDFGVGHSSLSRLRELPADCLKIDRSFVSACNVDERGRSVVETITRLANVFELQLVAEGIENQEELAFLKGLGIGRGQGELFALALSADQAEKLFGQSFYACAAEQEQPLEERDQQLESSL